MDYPRDLHNRLRTNLPPLLSEQLRDTGFFNTNFRGIINHVSEPAALRFWDFMNGVSRNDNYIVQFDDTITNIFCEIPGRGQLFHSNMRSIFWFQEEAVRNQYDHDLCWAYATTDQYAIRLRMLNLLHQDNQQSGTFLFVVGQICKY